MKYCGVIFVCGGPMFVDFVVTLHCPQIYTPTNMFYLYILSWCFIYICSCISYLWNSNYNFSKQWNFGYSQTLTQINLIPQYIPHNEYFLHLKNFAIWSVSGCKLNPAFQIFFGYIMYIKIGNVLVLHLLCDSKFYRFFIYAKFHTKKTFTENTFYTVILGQWNKDSLMVLKEKMCFFCSPVI
jgi:hypothetical protein